ncbi:pyridoxamine 5'-phosphate oxidase family protein [Deinococcus sp. AJ005]|uniref:pyridoxamine 5'-phosphate oxidase family protein n=1 Tax=Deinococcus sp. AJ005 TaxID=2652443 RepID=UPI00125CB62E|nr:pyridoxamine 5'-phosphate oxidase family protein [Deinococcus sp. AJ005]QFP77239.1 pyridoxamine 5'-phosphate oxidase family protein [Deinococcus sp. AJ005]
MTDFYDPQQRDPSVSRRPQNRRDDAWIQELLARVGIGRVATVWQSEDGQPFPFITTLAFAYRPEAHDIVYHTNITGRLWANVGQSQHLGHPTTFEATEIGCLLPSNNPLELSVQYRSAVAFGTARLLTDREEAREALRVLSERLFPDLRIGQQTRPILDADLACTSVYSLAVERWSGKENWQPMTDQTEDWPALTPELARLRPAIPNPAVPDPARVRP